MKSTIAIAKSNCVYGICKFDLNKRYLSFHAILTYINIVLLAVICASLEPTVQTSISCGKRHFRFITFLTPFINSIDGEIHTCEQILYRLFRCTRPSPCPTSYCCHRTIIGLTAHIMDIGSTHIHGQLHCSRHICPAAENHRYRLCRWASSQTQRLQVTWMHKASDTRACMMFEIRMNWANPVIC